MAVENYALAQHRSGLIQPAARFYWVWILSIARRIQSGGAVKADKTFWEL
jgi:hypothetical protein